MDWTGGVPAATCPWLPIPFLHPIDDESHLAPRGRGLLDRGVSGTARARRSAAPGGALLLRARNGVHVQADDAGLREHRSRLRQDAAALGVRLVRPARR